MTLFKPKAIPKTPEQIAYETAYPLLAAPWHGVTWMIRVRRLSDSAVLACGDFGLIQTFESKLLAKKEPTIKELNAYAERHHEICKLTMIQPTYDEAFAIAGAHIDSKEIDRQLKEIKDLWAQLPAGPERIQAEEEFNALELTSKFILPADFAAFITTYALSVDKSDLDHMTEEVMLNCAILADRGHDNPSDHFTGRIEPRVRKEFDNRAWVALDAEKKKLSRRAG